MELPFSERSRKRLKRAALLLWIAAIGYVVVSKGLEMDWPKVLEALRSFEATTMATAFALGIPAFLACATFDLIGRHATGHRLPVPRVMLISYIGYFFSLNLGALVGGLAFRYRLYMPYRLSGMTISQVIGLSIVTNWAGYVPVAGAVLAWHPPDLPSAWGVSEGVMRGTGALLLAISAGYLVLCGLRGGSRVNWKDSQFVLPTLKIAAMQVALSIVSWGSIGAVITWLIPGDVSWLAIMPVLMISAMAGIWSHVPSGLGVIELVFLTLLGHRVPDNELLAAVLVFRLVYYLVPFAAAIVGYVWLEVTARRADSR